MTDYQLYCGDCLDILPTLAAESVDLVFADPPFNVGIGYDGYSDNRADYYEWCGRWIGECFRVLKDTGTFYLMTITRHLPKLYPMMDLRGVFINQVNWKNVASANSKRCFWGEYQPILVFGKTGGYKFSHLAETRKTFLPWSANRVENLKGQLLDHWDDIPYVYAGSITHKEAVLIPGTNRKSHPAQMPVALPRRAVVFSTDTGDVVLDPFAGSFSTALACQQTGRAFIGIEQSEKYVQLGRERIEQAQPPLFTDPPAPVEKHEQLELSP